LTKGRIAYWKLFFDALIYYPRAFGTAMAIMGYHFQVITKRICSEAEQSKPSRRCQQPEVGDCSFFDVEPSRWQPKTVAILAAAIH
jgi:hypothetical protein